MSVKRCYCYSRVPVPLGFLYKQAWLSDFKTQKKQTQIAVQHADLDTLTLFFIVIIVNKVQRSWLCEQFNVRRDAIPNYSFELLGYETCDIASGLGFNYLLLALTVHGSHANLYDSMNASEWIYICNATIYVRNTTNLCTFVDGIIWLCSYT